MIEHGLLVAGHVVAGTERVQRDPECWYPPGDHCTRSRDPRSTDLLVLHWTAGRCGDDGRTVYRAMRGRKSKKRPGQPLDVGVQFVVGWAGGIWQLADAIVPCVHVGDRGVIARSIGVECRWPGTRRQASRLGIDGAWASMRVGGRRVDVMLPSEATLAAVCWLADTLADLRGQHGLAHGIAIPRRVPASNARFSRTEQRLWAGAQEHGQVPGSTKIDCAGLLTSALADHGWARG